MTALHGIRRLLAALCTIVAMSVPAEASVYSVPADCSKYFGDACSPAIGAWLPRVPGDPAWSADPKANTTSVHDEIVDPARRGPRVFGRLHGVLGGTQFVYGMAGPPRGNLVYDPVAHIAFYDEGCCAWHDVVVAATVSPPPKRVVARQLTGIRTARGITLGASPQRVRAVFGPAVSKRVPRRADAQLLKYQRPLTLDDVSSSCVESYAFLFEHGRLTAIDYGSAC